MPCLGDEEESATLCLTGRDPIKIMYMKDTINLILAVGALITAVTELYKEYGSQRIVRQLPDKLGETKKQ